MDEGGDICSYRNMASNTGIEVVVRLNFGSGVRMFLVQKCGVLKEWGCIWLVQRDR